MFKIVAALQQKTLQKSTTLVHYCHYSCFFLHHLPSQTLLPKKTLLSGQIGAPKSRVPSLHLEVERLGFFAFKVVVFSIEVWWQGCKTVMFLEVTNKLFFVLECWGMLSLREDGNCWWLGSIFSGLKKEWEETFLLSLSPLYSDSVWWASGTSPPHRCRKRFLILFSDSLLYPWSSIAATHLICMASVYQVIYVILL